MALAWNAEDWADPASERSGIKALVAPCAAPITFADLYRTEFPYVWRTARRLGVSPEEADDVVQETFLTVHRLLDTYEQRGSIQSWLFSLLFRVVQRHRRSQRRRTSRTDDGADIDLLPASAARSPEKTAENNQTVRILEEILDKLDDDKRAVLVLAELEEKPVAEIAEILGLNVNTATSRLRAAREHVEASLSRHRARDGWRLK